MKYDPQKHHRRSIRLPDYDYSQPGAYFITLVTYQRDCLFGSIVQGEMQLSSMGKVAEDHWHLIPEHFAQVELGAYVIMPNHVHGIIIINGYSNASAFERTGTTMSCPYIAREKFGKPVKGSIPTIIRSYKASVTRSIQQGWNASGIWQRNYYEHIIRDEAEYNRIHKYIESNPANWVIDDGYSAKST
jgi:REP element-mobilizing transposase RayT